MAIFNKVLFFVLVAAILVCIGSIIYIASIANKADSFTEFYILNADGKAADYPYEVKSGTPANIIIGVINHEKKSVDYKVVISIGDVIIKTVYTGTVQDNHKWEENVAFSHVSTGDNQKVEFHIYANNETVPLQKDPLSITIKVID